MPACMPGGGAPQPRAAVARCRQPVECAEPTNSFAPTSPHHRCLYEIAPLAEKADLGGDAELCKKAAACR